ncbi:MAG: molecular chaperone TorD family protein [Treponema sp.]|nr:molecular chaperone TorD family protein [Treponema sp.]
MVQCRDEIAIVLAGRSYIYQLLTHIFREEPSLQLLEGLTGDFTAEVLDLMLDEESLEPCKALFAQLRAEISASPSETLERLKSEYVYLMLGPENLPAPPWESVYISQAPLLFQESTLKVRQAYLEYDLLPAAYPHEADDHLALELNFMAHLGQLSRESFEKNDIPRLQKILSDQKAFLENHLLVWIGDFAEQMQHSKKRSFYPQIAVLVKHILHADLAALDELLSVCDNAPNGNSV